MFGYIVIQGEKAHLIKYGVRRSEHGSSCTSERQSALSLNSSIGFINVKVLV